MKTIEGHFWSIAYAHHYRDVAEYDQKEHDYRKNGAAFVLARTAPRALALFREAHADTKAYVVHSVGDRGGSDEVIVADEYLDPAN